MKSGAGVIVQQRQISAGFRSNMEFSIVIPLFNEKESLPRLQKKLYKTMESISCDYEIIYIDDGSTDSSLTVLQGLKRSCSKMRIISLKKNTRKSAALLVGFKASIGKWIITIDADGQDPPEEIVKLLKFKDDFDFIMGIRKKRKDNFLRKVSSQIAKFFRWLVLKDITKDAGCSLRVFKREAIGALPLFRNFHRFLPFLVRAEEFSVKEVEIEHNQRKFGKSKYGVLERAWEGIFDLWGVFWLKKRWLNYEIKYKC